MAAVVLARPDVGLFADFEASRVELPRMSSMVPTREREAALVRFDGDREPTPFAGEGTARSTPIVVRFWAREHAIMDALLDLFAAAHAGEGQRVMVRPNAFAVGALNGILVGTVAGDVATPVDGGAGAWDVAWTLASTRYTLEV